MIATPRVHTKNIHQQIPHPESTSTLSRALRFSGAIVGRTYLIVDNSNILLGGRDRDFRIDYGDPVLKFLGGDLLVSASIVVSQPLGAQRQSQMSFYGHLKQLGWRIYRHLALQNNIGEFSENEALVDGDVRTLIRAAANSPDCDSICLLSGDGGMTSSVLYAQRAGKKVFVIGWDQTIHPALAAVATDTATIDELRPLISRVLH